MQLTWIDAIFFGVLVYFFIKGWARGFLYLSTSVVSFGFSLIISLRLTRPVGVLLSDYVNIPSVWSGIVAYFMIAFVSQTVLSYVFSSLLSKTAPSVKNSHINRFVGSVFSGFSGVLLFSIFLFFVLLVPVQGSVKQAIRDSTIAPVVIAFIDEYGGPLPKVLSDSAKQLTEFLTINPNSTERLPLKIGEIRVMEIDEVGEEQMLQLVNNERERIGLPPLTISFAIREVARQHSIAMLKEKYFSHRDAFGDDVGDRLTESGVKYFFAGENLAYAPDIHTAHTGLMDSPGHKQNLLDPDFRRVGVGIVDAGIWGKMVTQVFAD